MIKYINSKKIKYLFILFFLNIGLVKSFGGEFYIGSNFTHNTVNLKATYDFFLRSLHRRRVFVDTKEFSSLKTKRQSKDIFSIGVGYKIFLFDTDVFLSPELFFNFNNKLISKVKYRSVGNVYDIHKTSIKEYITLNSKFGYCFDKYDIDIYFVLGFSFLSKLKGEFLQNVSFNQISSSHLFGAFNFGLGIEYRLKSVGINFSIVQSIAVSKKYELYDLAFGNIVYDISYNNTKLAFGINYYFGNKNKGE